MKPSVLVIGGAGYIGSHMVRALSEGGYQPVIFDNLSTGHRELVAENVPWIQGDLRHAEDVARVFNEHEVRAVMHFAASSIVPESVREPLHYYQNNVSAFIVLLEQMIAHQVGILIFSSSAAVYGEPDQIPIQEESAVHPKNPYGRSKRIMEQILADISEVRPLAYVALRYFNAAGAHPSGAIGEWHEPETHLIPNLLAAAGNPEKKFTLYGNDYPTPDGTCVRDYIHVQDLCQAHLLALRYLEQGGKSDIFNLGSEHGYSVKEMVKAAERATQKKIAVLTASRRPGDPSTLIADARKAKRMLGWQPKENLESILSSAFRWQETKRRFENPAERKTVFIAAKEGVVCLKKS